MIFQKAKPKYISNYLSLFNVNNRNEVDGFARCQWYVSVHWVFRRIIIWVVRVTSSKSSMSSDPTWSAPSIFQIAKKKKKKKKKKILSIALCRLSSVLKMILLNI